MQSLLSLEGPSFKSKTKHLLKEWSRISWWHQYEQSILHLKTKQTDPCLKLLSVSGPIATDRLSLSQYGDFQFICVSETE